MLRCLFDILEFINAISRPWFCIGTCNSAILRRVFGWSSWWMFVRSGFEVCEFINVIVSCVFTYRISEMPFYDMCLTYWGLEVCFDKTSWNIKFRSAAQLCVFCKLWCISVILWCVFDTAYILHVTVRFHTYVINRWLFCLILFIKSNSSTRCCWISCYKTRVLSSRGTLPAPGAARASPTNPDHIGARTIWC